MHKAAAYAIALMALASVLSGCSVGASPRVDMAPTAQSTAGASAPLASPSVAPQPTPTLAAATILAGRASTEAAPTTLPAVTATRPLATASPARSATAARDDPPAPALYPIPTTCAVAPWSGIERRRTFPAFWLDGDGLAAGNPIASYFFEGEYKVQWQAEPGGNRTLVLTGARLDGPAPAPPQIVNQYVIGVGTWSTSTAFPAPGCWRIEATDGVHTLAAIVYVFPRACTPPAIRDPREQVAGDCAPPARRAVSARE